MDDELNPSEAVPGGDDITPAGGSEDDSQAAVGFKDVIKQATGRDYPDDETALKAVQDTFKHVGKAGQQVKTLETQLAEAKAAQASDTTPELAKEVADLKSQMAIKDWYEANPKYNNSDAKSLILEMGNNPTEVVEKEAFKKAYKAIQSNAEAEKSKSVLESNPRLGQATDKITQAKEALKAEDHSAASQAATDAVMGAYDLK